MTNLISSTISHISNVLKQFQVKRFLAVALVGFLLLTTNVAPEHGSNKALTNKIDELVHQDDSQRPKTTGDWNKEARETEDAPGERLQRIGKQTAEAVKDFGSVYPDTAERSANAEQ
ncbi:unknown protein [Rivularia sp. IAM M-261]|jgi:hypothetical protein|nr:unknown protein [Calothrix sp. PCC 7716]GJD15283.1 unknown protein [Rivularia sp. IAM M-261]